MSKKELEQRVDLLYQMIQTNRKQLDLYRKWFEKINVFMKMQNKFDTELIDFVKALNNDVDRLLELNK